MPRGNNHTAERVESSGGLWHPQLEKSASPIRRSMLEAKVPLLIDSANESMTTKKLDGSGRERFLDVWQTGGRFWRVISFLLMFCFFLTSALPSRVSARSFEVYIHTNYKNQPDLSTYGAKKLRIMPAGNFYSKGQDRQELPSKNRVIQFVAGKYNDYTGFLVINIEHWPLISSDAEVASRVKKFITVLEWVKSAAPKAKVGYYGVVPHAGFWAAHNFPSHPKYKKWQKNNDRAQALADRVDAFFPSLYPVDAKQESWVRWATAQVNEANRLGKGKPVYPFINPRYHSNAYNGLPYKPVPKDFFALQATTLRNVGAEGVVIWGADNRNKQWSENLPWWQATKEFLPSLR
ncbi:MAG: hypothetical protein ACREX4_19785 [Gammaproteobacteria bacterium]